MRFPDTFPAAMAVVVLSLVAMAGAELAGLKGWGGFFAGLAALFAGGPLAAQAEAWWRRRANKGALAVPPMAGGSQQELGQGVRAAAGSGAGPGNRAAAGRRPGNGKGRHQGRPAGYRR